MQYVAPLALLLLTLACTRVPAQITEQDYGVTIPYGGETSIYELYPGEAIPRAAGNPASDSISENPAIGTFVQRVRTPTLHHFAPLPRLDRKAAIVIAPGGGYYIQAWDWEGQVFADRLTAEGYHVFVLRYRLPATISDPECRAHAALTDARRGVRMTRVLADSLGYDPHKIALMGFSAGGHLAGSAAVHFEPGDSTSLNPYSRVSSRPDLSVLVYAVLSMDGSEDAHAGSAGALLGPDYTEHPLRDFFDLPAQVHADVPPTLLVHASDDEGVPPGNSLAYYAALRESGVPAALHVFAEGGHGFGLGTEPAGPTKNWVEILLAWLDGREF